MSGGCAAGSRSDQRGAQRAWTPEIDAPGDPRDGTGIAEITGLLN